MANGFWQWWYDNKQLHREETFRRGKEDGEVIEYDTIGEVLTHGEFIDGLREGKWLYHVNDYREEGEYRDDLKHGVWQSYYDNDKLSFKGEYINGLAINKHKFYYPNGKLHWVGEFSAGFKDGEWKEYNKERVLIYSIEYKRGVEIKIDGFKIKPIKD